MQQNSLRTSVRRFSGPVLLGLGLLAACQRPATTTPARISEAGGTSSPVTAAAPAAIANPVLPGDFPDPSVVKVGDTYWATATSSN